MKVKKRTVLWNVCIVVLIRMIPFIVIPEQRAFVMENPTIILQALAQAVAIGLVLLLGVFILLKWVRGGKKEEDAS